MRQSEGTQMRRSESVKRFQADRERMSPQYDYGVW